MSFPDLQFRLGISMAASWAWGVSLAVSFAILSTRGLVPFLIWGTANVAAILVYGLFIRHFPIYLQFGNNYFVILFMGIIQIFAIWINFKIMAVYTSINIAMVISIIIFICVFIWGFRFSVDSDLYQYLIMVCGLFIVILLGTLHTGINIVELTKENIQWAIFGGIGLLSGPFLDAQQLQRAKEAHSIIPFLIGSSAFGFYLALVYFAASYAEGASAILLAIIVIAVATSTLDSCVASLQHIIGPPLACFISIVALFSWRIMDTTSISEFWYMYAVARIYIVVPLLLLAIFLTKWMNKQRKNIS
jgi:hypothetical protein